MSRPLLRWFVLALVIGAGCDTNPVEPVMEPPTFHVGRRWVYTWDAVTRDSLGNIVTHFHDSVEVRVVSVDDTGHGMTGLVRTDGVSFLPWAGPGPAPGIHSFWYQITSSAVVEHAYRNPGATAFVQLTAGGPRQRLTIGTFFEPLRSVVEDPVSDSIQWRSDPRRVLVFPLRSGTTWDVFLTPFHQRREVMGIETIRVLGRDMNAARIRTTMPDFDPTFEWDDWVSRDGLLSRVVRVNMEMVDENMQPAGRFQYSETSTLVVME